MRLKHADGWKPFTGEDFQPPPVKARLVGEAFQPLLYNNRMQYPGYNKVMSLRGGEADAAILWCCDGAHKDDGIASLRSQ